MDTGPLGKIISPRKFPESEERLQRLVDAGEAVVVPEISDYELRRGLLCLNDLIGVQRLDDLCALLDYVPITTAAMRKAADFWADARRRGYATAPDPALDGDMILAAQAVTLGDNVVIATENASHLRRYASASPWDRIA